MLLSACVSVSPYEKTGVQIGKIYKFSNVKFNDSLYVLFLPQDGENKALLFSTQPNATKVTAVIENSPGVYKQDWFNVTEEGLVSFRCSEKGTFNEVIKNHKYFSSGSERNGMVGLSYKLDFNKAVIIS